MSLGIAPWLQAPARERVRVMAVQYRQARIRAWDDFVERIEYFCAVAADYAVDFVCFPEFMALQLLSMAPRRLPAAAAMEQMGAHAAGLDALYEQLARTHRINLISGAYPRRCADGRVRNLASVYGRDGTIAHRAKIHVTPSEADTWGVVGGTLEDCEVVATDCGPIGVMICYDSEFPELARRHVDQGALIEFIPYCTDERQGHLRVRYSAHARCIENQSYAVLAGNVGHLPGVLNMDIQYAESAVLTPCDYPFARDGIAAQANADAEAVVLADLDLAALVRARHSGTVRNLRDRRRDLYRLDWTGEY